MYNELFSIGPLTVYGYGLCIGLGVVAALLLCWRRAGNRGLNTDIPTELTMLALIFGFAGAKVLYILTSMDEFLADPMSVLGFEGFVLCPLPATLYRNLLTTYLGFPHRGFFSTDYFPLLPWFFLFVTGYFLHRVLDQRNLTQRLFARGRVPVLNWMGNHSLIIYLLHQPILYGLCLLFF